MPKEVRILLGSISDNDNANVILEILHDTGITCAASVVSCHRNAGEEFNDFVLNIKENIIVFIGGMSLAAPGLIESILRNNGRFDQIVFAVPTDKAARSAIEDLPMGTAIITSGLNEISLKHSLANSALSIAKMALMLSSEPATKLADFYKKLNRKKQLVEDLNLEGGKII